MPVKNENLDLVNENIKSAQLLVIDENGEQLGVLSKEDALEKAYDRDLDLVVVAAKANPPVVWILLNPVE